MDCPLHVAFLILLCSTVATCWTQRQIKQLLEDIEMITRFSYMVSFKVCIRRCYHCSGSFLSNHIVLTAAHCLCEGGRRAQPRNITVYIHSKNMGAGRTTSVTRTKMKYPAFCVDLSSRRERVKDDVALLYLRMRVPSVNALKVYCGQVRASESFKFAGYGGSGGHRLRMGQGTFKAVPCLFYKYIVTSGRGLLCADPSVIPQKPVDDGGPVLVTRGHRLQLAGVMSLVFRSPQKERELELVITPSRWNCNWLKHSLTQTF